VCYALTAPPSVAWQRVILTALSMSFDTPRVQGLRFNVKTELLG
jgi:hypothetical protein